MYIGLNNRVTSGVVGKQSTDEMIRKWRRARLSTGVEALGYPTENILSKFGMSRSTRPPPLPDGELTDADIVQSIVDRMEKHIKAVFEAYYLMLIRGNRCRELPHKARALTLGITEKTYRSRRCAGYEFLQRELSNYI